MAHLTKATIGNISLLAKLLGFNNNNGTQKDEDITNLFIFCKKKMKHSDAEQYLCKSTLRVTLSTHRTPYPYTKVQVQVQDTSKA